MISRVISAAVAACLSVTAQAAWAQGAGQEEFMQACATCHGVSAQGDGPLAGILTVAVPDLTTISARNDEVFPMLDVIQIIDGRMQAEGHGFPMPVWGDRFEAEASAEGGPYGTELLVRGRVLALATYLESIQQ